MHCPTCQTADTVTKWGRTKAGSQRYRCSECRATMTEPRPASPIAPMRLPFDRAVMILSMLVEGMSIRATERVTGHHRDTIMRLQVLAGEKAGRLLDELVRDVPVEDVQADELWAFVGMKERTKTQKGLDSRELGDAYTYLGIERNSKLILTHHTGRRTWNDTEVFVSQLAKATAGTFQLTTDGLDSYPYAVRQHLGHRVDYAQLIKQYGQDAEGQRRYSPPRIIGAEKHFMIRFPDPDRVCTSHVERVNLDVRMKNRRFTRLTNAFSKVWRNHRASVALTVAHFNLCKMHSAIRMTPAMKAGLTNRIWSVGELLAA